MSVFLCKHCTCNITLDDAPNHECFFGKTVYLDQDNTSLYTQHDEIDKPLDLKECSEDDPSLLKIPTKQNAVWTNSSTLTLLNVYEANLHKLDHKNKKTQLWSTISQAMKQFIINVSADQVRWKINALVKKYKECPDNNRRSGRSFIGFEFYDVLEEIFQKQRKCGEAFTLASNLPVETKNSFAPLCTRASSENLFSQKETIKKEKMNTLTCGSSLDFNISESLVLVKRKVNDKSLLEPNILSKRKEAYKSPLGSGSKNAKTKLELEKRWLQYLTNNEHQLQIREEKYEKYLKLKSKENQLKKRYLNLREKEIEQKNEITTKKKKLKQEKHNERMELEKLKCKYLAKLASANTNDSNSD